MLQKYAYFHETDTRQLLQLQGQLRLECVPPKMSVSRTKLVKVIMHSESDFLQKNEKAYI